MPKKADRKPGSGRPTSTKYDPVLQLARARGLTLEQAAKLAGCSIDTACRRERDSGYLAGIEQIRERMIGEGVNLLAASFVKAVNKVLEIMEGEDVPHAVQLKAAQQVIDSLLKVREHVTLSSRMAAIAEKLGIGAGDGQSGKDNSTDAREA